MKSSPGIAARIQLRRFAPPLMAVATALGLALCSLGPYMHESDQASIIGGALDLAAGLPDWQRDAYNYDKQFVSYWLLAGIFRLLGRPWQADQIMLASNLVSFAFFWGMLAWHLARFGRRLSKSWLAAVLLAPAFLLHSPFFATAFLAAGFLLLVVRVLALNALGGWRGFLRRLAIFAVAFAAVGARADSVLALPLLALSFTRVRGLNSLIRSGDVWAMFAGALAALLVGRLASAGHSLNYLPPFFNPKIILAYTVFGLGAAALLLPASLAALVLCAAKLKARRVELLLLASALAVPLLYYCVQLTSTRYFVLGLVCLLLFLSSRPGAGVLRMVPDNHFAARVFNWVLVSASVGPLIIGLNVAFLRQPKVTWNHATRFPTADGALPMGAYLKHAARLRGNRGLVDHNHAIWLAATHSAFGPAGSSPAILRTPMCDYLTLAARLQGTRPHLIEVAAAATVPSLYLDSRSLMRRTVSDLGSLKSAPPLSALMSSRSLRQVSSRNVEGLTVFATTTSQADMQAGGLILALNSELHENEYRLKRSYVFGEKPSRHEFAVESADAGKTLVLLSEQKFQCLIENPAGNDARSEPREIPSADGRRWFAIQLNAIKPGTKLVLEAPAGAEVTLAITVYPDWMSLGNL